MEPVKGGTLANPPAKVRELFKAAAPDMSLASWAIRYIASLPGILTILSGMSNVEQMADNISYMRADAFRPLDQEGMEVIRKAPAALAAIPSIPCTGCSYCTPGCPQNIPIPDIFEARNHQLVFENEEAGQRSYNFHTANKGKASDCIACGQCEGACPQRINIIERLKDCAEAFDH
jgi:predicted aldo/keto reductase-like oxidoreductase